MKRVITYGTFDLFHTGHYNLLKRAKELGDYLVVGVTTENYDQSRGKLNVQDSLAKRLENVKKTGFADEIIVEEFEGQKINDIQKYNIDTFVIGSDWIGKFDYLKSYCEVVYLERTKGISSTELRSQHIIRLGIVGYGRIAERFVPESKYVSGIDIKGVYGPKIEKAGQFANKHELDFFTAQYDRLLENVDAVYIATPHPTHYQYAKDAIIQKKHVLCEKPMVLSAKEAEELFKLSQEQNVVLLEAIKTAYSPAFNHLTGVAKSGQIGFIKSVDATFTKLMKPDPNLREFKVDCAGGSVTELASYPLLAAVKLLGVDIRSLDFYSYNDPKNKVDLFTRIRMVYAEAIASATVGLGVKSEGALVVSGTEGYIYVPAPWWKTEYYEVRFENPDRNRKYFFKFEEDGLRYEIAEFVSMINRRELSTYKLLRKESVAIAGVIERFLSQYAW